MRRRAVLLLLALAGGCAGEPAPPDPRPPAPASAGTVTEVLTFQAYDDAGLLPHLARAAAVTGSCAGGSRVHAGRFDAWRCQAGDVSFDPCFSNHTGEELACAGDPWAREVTVLRPPAPLGRAGSNRNDPSASAWGLELADGTRCTRTPGAAYRCAGGADAGEPDTTRPIWTARRAGVSVDVRTAWY